jgi:hypothetical protein
MCIYLVNQLGLLYNSAEHIIPAGLGGIQKLPAEYVSAEFNNKSSALELTFMRSSLIALPRQILGPGKRGSQAASRATKSRVTVFSQQPREQGFSLGYIQLGVPVEIPHISFDRQNGAYTIGIAKEATEKDIQEFKRKLLNFDEKHVRLIKHESLGTTVLLGVQAGMESSIDYYIASQDGINHPFTADLVAEFAVQIIDKSTFIDTDRYHVRTHQSATINDGYFRCCAKIAFNALAHLKGHALATHECFNSFKHWIINGGKNNFVELAPNLHTNNKQIFPEYAHYILITKVGKRLIADVCFYNHFHHTVYLTDDFPDAWHLEGFVCDWQIKKEYELYEFLAKLPDLEVVL